MKQINKLLNYNEQIFNKLSQSRLNEILSKTIIRKSFKLSNENGTYKFIKADYKGEVLNFYARIPTEDTHKKTSELWSFYLKNRG